MGRFYKGEVAELLGGAGRVLIRSYDYTDFPGGVGSIIGLADPWNPVGPWTDIGFTTGGVTIRRSVEMNVWNADLAANAGQAPMGWTHTVSFNLASMTTGNLSTAWLGGAGSKYGTARKVGQTRMLAICFMNVDDEIWAWAFRRVQVAEMGDVVLNRGEMLVAPVTFACLAELHRIGGSYLKDDENVFAVYSA